MPVLEEARHSRNHTGGSVASQRELLEAKASLGQQVREPPEAVDVGYRDVQVGDLSHHQLSARPLESKPFQKAQRDLGGPSGFREQLGFTGECLPSPAEMIETVFARSRQEVRQAGTSQSGAHRKQNAFSVRFRKEAGQGRRGHPFDLGNRGPVRWGGGELVEKRQP
ncbi:MAG: hypothetical protein AAGN46_04385 [Acidobacteriota bacterium]